MSTTYPENVEVARSRFVRTTPWLHDANFISQEKYADGSPKRDYWIRRTKWHEGFEHLMTGERCLTIYTERLGEGSIALWSAQFPATRRMLERLGYDAETAYERLAMTVEHLEAGGSPYWVEIDGLHLEGRPMVCLAFPEVVPFELHVENGAITTVITGRTTTPCMEAVMDRLPMNWAHNLRLRWIQADDLGSMIEDAVKRSPKLPGKPVVLGFQAESDRMMLVGTTDGAGGEPGKAEMLLEINWAGIGHSRYHLPLDTRLASPHYWGELPRACQAFLVEQGVMPYVFNRRVDELLTYTLEGNNFEHVPSVSITFAEESPEWVTYAMKGLKHNIEFRLPVTQDFTYEVNGAGNAVIALATREDLCHEHQ